MVWQQIKIIIFLLLPCLLFAGAHYVDSGASGANDGSSWTDAWESFADITWEGAGVTAGDTLYISGGADSTVYNASLDIQASGTSGNLIVIMCGTDASHNGLVVITDNVTITNEEYVKLYGNTGYDIKIRNVTGDGLTMNYITGVIAERIDLYYSSDDGISVDEYDGGDNYIRYCKLHDNYDYNIIVNRPVLDDDAPYADSSHLFIEYNEIYNMGQDGIHCAAYAGGVCIRYNNIHTQITGDAYHYSGYIDGMQLRGWKHLSVYGNWIHDLWATDGLNAYIFVECDVAVQTNTLAHDIYIFNNVITETDHTTNPTQNSKGIEFKPRAAGSLRKVLIANNTIVDTRVYGIEMHDFDNLPSDNIENVVVINNIIYNNDQRTGGSGDRLSFTLHELQAGVTTGSLGEEVDIVWDYNLVDALVGTATCRYGGPGTGVLMDYSAFNAASGCDDHGVEADPTFTNYSENGVTAATDLQLDGSDATARNAGTASTIFTVDYNGVTRPQDALWDIGAWEVVSSPPPPANKAFVPGGVGILIPAGNGKIITE